MVVSFIESQHDADRVLRNRSVLKTIRGDFGGSRK